MLKIPLYTFQPPGFDITTGNLDLSKSENYSFFKRAYDWLFSQIGTNQVLWSLLGFFEKEKEFLRFGPNHAELSTLWELSVPESAIIRCLDIDGWHDVINDSHLIPADLYEKWESEGDDQYIDQQWDKYCKKYLKEDTWQKVFVPFKMDKYLDILLSFPIKEEWVVRKSLLSGYDLDLFDGFNDLEYGNIDHPFKTYERANSFLNAIKSSLEKQQKNFSWRLSQNYSAINQDPRFRVKFINNEISNS